jgi:DNA-binding response OmpR family regulator
LELGFFRYLTKPIKVKEFMDTLNAALEFAENGCHAHDMTQDKCHDPFIGHS